MTSSLVAGVLDTFCTHSCPSSSNSLPVRARKRSVVTSPNSHYLRGRKYRVQYIFCLLCLAINGASTQRPPVSATSQLCAQSHTLNACAPLHYVPATCALVTHSLFLVLAKEHRVVILHERIGKRRHFRFCLRTAPSRTAFRPMPKKDTLVADE